MHSFNFQDQKKGKDGLLEKYLKQLWDRPFENIDQEWQSSRKVPGSYKRVHSDKKSTADGLYCMFIGCERAPKSAGGSEMCMIYLSLGGRNWRKENVLVKAEIAVVSVLDGKMFKSAFRDMLEVRQPMT